MDNKGTLIVVLILAGVILLATGALNNIFPNNGTPGTDNGAIAKCPSDLKTSITLNTKDALSSTDLSANVSYYVLKSTGEFVKSGSTSAGTATFDVQCGGDYRLIAYDDDGTKPDYYPQEVTFTADAGEGSVKTINMALNKEGGAQIIKLSDPTDLNENLSMAASSVTSFDVIYKENETNAAFNNPAFVVDVNTTCVSDVKMPNAQSIACPKKTIISSGRTDYCFGTSTPTLSSQGPITNQRVNLKFGSTACGTVDYVNVTMIDQQEYKDPDYVIKGISGFHLGYENANTNADVGAVDSFSRIADYSG